MRGLVRLYRQRGDADTRGDLLEQIKDTFGTRIASSVWRSIMVRDLHV